MTDTVPTRDTTAVAERPAARRLTGRRGRAALSEGARAERRLAWLLCAPAAVVMVLVTAYPLIYAAIKTQGPGDPLPAKGCKTWHDGR